MYTDERLEQLALMTKESVDVVFSARSILIAKTGNTLAEVVKRGTTYIHYRDRALGLALFGIGLVDSVMDKQHLPYYDTTLEYGSTALYAAAVLLEE